MSQKGTLVMVGTGIRALGQLTFEAIEHIEKADRVYYAVRDSATKGFIEAKNPDTVDLDRYYACDENIPKLDIFIQMAELMVADVRKGLRVVGAFYGHPAKFMHPTRRALAIAQAEGHTIMMLPGISTEDCLMADLGIDPSFSGLQITDAPDFLMYDRPLLTSSHVVMYEVGQLGFDIKEKNNFFEHLVTKLEKIYGSSHSVVNYTCATSAIVQPVIDRLTIGDLSKPEIRRRITASSTLYIPPKEVLPLSAFGRDLIARGQLTQEQLQNSIYPPNPIYTYQPDAGKTPEAYTEYANKAIAGLQGRKLTTPSGYRPYCATPAMQKAIETISLSMDAREEYLRCPSEFAASIEGLEDTERAALASGSFVRIDAVMKGAPPTDVCSIDSLHISEDRHT